MQILRVAVPVPLYSLFDYLPPAGEDASDWQPGSRIRVPFGRRNLVGVLVAVTDRSQTPESKLRAASARIDEAPVLASDLLQLVTFVASYYHHPIGEVFQAALPVRLRQGDAAEVPAISCWDLTTDGRAIDLDSLGRAVRQQRVLAALRRAGGAVPEPELRSLAECDAATLRAVEAKGWITAVSAAAPDVTPVAGPALNAAQARCVAEISEQATGFHAWLLQGVTGSGKTEVYLSAAAEVLAGGGQVLVMVPEITLSPQIADRFRQRFGLPMAVFHSRLTDTERLRSWAAARSGEARIIIGTRSAVFAPAPGLGLVIVDEEHDMAYKQQDGLRYSARDVAVRRAAFEEIPVILGSATPSLESLENARRGRYGHLTLDERAAGASSPVVQAIDVRSRPMQAGLSPPLIEAIRRHLDKDGQCLLYLNRRGFAPALLCHDCGWLADCSRCDAHMVLHQKLNRLRCHHCGQERPMVKTCPSCQSSELIAVGQGTQRVEEALQDLFPDIGIARVDRDVMSRKDAWQECMASIESGETRILVGTQMLTKGHDFPGITLVGILDGDQGLFGSDFRAGERMAQLVIQVSGRAGRGEKAGEVYIQTHHPEHEMLQTLLSQDYDAFAELALEERQAGGFPPFAHLALLRAESVQPAAPGRFLNEARQQLVDKAGGIEVWGPVPAPMPRRGGRLREQLLIQSAQRKPLHDALAAVLPELARSQVSRGVRWSVDVDPQDML